MLLVLAASTVGLAIVSFGLEDPGEQTFTYTIEVPAEEGSHEMVMQEESVTLAGMTGGSVFWILFGSFLMSFGIAIVAVMGGIGGGVLFTPIMLAFTNVNSLIIRATGLIVAMFSGLISTGPFMRRGLANIKICIMSAAAYGIGAFTGAQAAILVADKLGATGEGLVRMALGVIILALAAYFIIGGQKIEWPNEKKVDRFTRWMRLKQPYYEASMNKVIDYEVTRAWLLVLVIVIVGPLVRLLRPGRRPGPSCPALNMVMAVPLKVAAACSGGLLGMGDCVALWPYMLKGAINPALRRALARGPGARRPRGRIRAHEDQGGLHPHHPDRHHVLHGIRPRDQGPHGARRHQRTPQRG